MARKHNLAEVLQTEVSGSMPLKTLAKVLAGKGRRGDTMLAHITPKEAKKLKKMGGSGTTNPETGLPEFFGEDGFDYPTFEPSSFEAPVNLPTFAQDPAYTSPTYYGGDAPRTISDYGSSQGTFASPTGLAYDVPYASEFAGGLGAQTQASPYDVAGGGFDLGRLFGGGQTVVGAPVAPGTTDVAAATKDMTPKEIQEAYKEDYEKPSFVDPQTGEVKTGSEEDKGLFGKMGLSDILKLGVGGIGALMGRSQQQAAIKQAAAAAQQYKDAAAAASQQYKDLAQPLLGPGYTALSQAQQGALSAANRQAFDVARARAAQASARSGGVGAVQTAMEEGRMYQQMVSTQLQQAMQLIAPGNSLASAAISTTLAGQQGALKLQLDLENQANQAATNMYSALAKMVA